MKELINLLNQNTYAALQGLTGIFSICMLIYKYSTIFLDSKNVEKLKNDLEIYTKLKENQFNITEVKKEIETKINYIYASDKKTKTTSLITHYFFISFFFLCCFHSIELLKNKDIFWGMTYLISGCFLLYASAFSDNDKAVDKKYINRIFSIHFNNKMYIFGGIALLSFGMIGGYFTLGIHLTITFFFGLSTLLGFVFLIYSIDVEKYT